MSVDLKREKSTIAQDEKGTDFLFEGDQKLVRKIDWRLLPSISLLYGLALIDRYPSQYFNI
jgi:hypothetical protein